MIPLYGCEFLQDGTQLTPNMRWVTSSQLFYNESDAEEYGAYAVGDDMYIYAYRITPFYIQEKNEDR